MAGIAALIVAGLLFDLSPGGWVSGSGDGVCVPVEGDSQGAGLASCDSDGDCPDAADCRDAFWEDGEQAARFCVNHCDPQAESSCAQGFECVQTEPDAPTAKGCGGAGSAPPVSQDKLAQSRGQALRETVRKEMLNVHWTFESADNPGKDEKGSHPATLKGGAARVEDDQRGWVLRLPSGAAMMTLDDVVELGDTWTISAWFKGLKPNQSWRTLTRGADTDHQIIVQSGSNALGVYDNRGRRGFIAAGFDTLALRDGAWHQIVAVGTDNATRFYVDGALVGEVDFQSRSNVVAVGNYQAGGQAFADYLDDVKISSAALSPEDVRDEYDAGRQRLLAHFTFNEDSLGFNSVGERDAIFTGDAALAQDGERGPVLQVPDLGVMAFIPIPLGNAWTLTGWFKGLKSSASVRTFAEGSSGHRYATTPVGAGSLGATGTGGAFAPSGFDLSTLDAGAWHHLAAVGSSPSWENPRAVTDWTGKPCAGYQNVQVVQNLIDGDADTFWNAAGCGNAAQWQVTFDLGEARTFASMRMRSIGNGGHDPRTVTLDAMVAGSWTRVTTCARQAGTAEHQRCDFDAPVTTQQFRISMPGWGRTGGVFHENGHWQYYINDVQFRATGGQTRFYVNGALVGESLASKSDALAAIGNSAGGHEPFADFIDEIKVFATALSHADVALEAQASRRTATMAANKRGQDLSGKDYAGADMRWSDMSDANLTDADLSRANMTDANFSGANFSGARLNGADLSGADLSGADMATSDLTGVKAHNLRGCPRTLPPGFKCVNKTLVGPGVNLSGADLSGADLAGVSLLGAAATQIRATTLIACPATAPAGFKCVNKNLAGPTADLSGADLSGADLANLSLDGARLDHVKAVGLLACPSALASRWRCLTQGDKRLLAGPKANLTGADLSNMDFKDVDLMQANLTGANLKDLKAQQMRECRDVLPATLRCTWATTPSGWILLGPGMDLANTDLTGLNLSGVDLSGAKLDRANFTAVNLSDADLRNAHAPSAVFMAADLSRANLQGPQTHMHRADFRGANLEGADLRGTWLTQTLLRSSNLGDAVFDDKTVLIEADLRWITFDGIDMKGLNLERAFLSSYGPRVDHLTGTGDLVPGTDFGGTIVLNDLFQSNFQRTLADDHNGGGGIRAVNLTTCPGALPAAWRCVETQAQGKVLVGPMANLREVNLSHLTLDGLIFYGADLSQANLDGVKVTNCRFYGTNLSGASVKGASFYGDEAFTRDHWIFDNAEFKNADLTGSDFTYARAINHERPQDVHGAQRGHHNIAGCPAATHETWSCRRSCEEGCLSTGNATEAQCAAACEPWQKALVYNPKGFSDHPFGWKDCAQEGALCTPQGRRLVRYGSDGFYFYFHAEEAFECTWETLGHPTDPYNERAPRKCQVVDTALLPRTHGEPIQIWTKVNGVAGTWSSNRALTLREKLHTVTGTFHKERKGGTLENMPAPSLTRWRRGDYDAQCANNPLFPFFENQNRQGPKERCFQFIEHKRLCISKPGTILAAPDGTCQGFSTAPAPTSRSADSEVGLLLILPRSVSQTPGDGRSWSQCASEGGTCRLSEEKLVRYGANGKFFYFQASSDFLCSFSELGHPNDPSDKSAPRSCDVTTNQSPPPHTAEVIHMRSMIDGRPRHFRTATPLEPRQDIATASGQVLDGDTWSDINKRPMAASMARSEYDAQCQNTPLYPFYESNVLGLDPRCFQTLKDMVSCFDSTRPGTLMIYPDGFNCKDISMTPR